jgi:hypothetical protein
MELFENSAFVVINRAVGAFWLIALPYLYTTSMAGVFLV